MYGDREEDQNSDKGTHWVYAFRNSNVEGVIVMSLNKVDIYDEFKRND